MSNTNCLRVLLVDDDADTRGFYRWVFENEGYRVDEAENGAVAVALVRSLHPDLVILDNNMPVMSGVDCARVLRADPACAAIPIIMLSGGPRSALSALDLTLCQAYVVKPVTFDELLAHATAVLAVAAVP